MCKKVALPVAIGIPADTVPVPVISGTPVPVPMIPAAPVSIGPTVLSGVSTGGSVSVTSASGSSVAVGSGRSVGFALSSPMPMQVEKRGQFVLKSSFSKSGDSFTWPAFRFTSMPTLVSNCTPSVFCDSHTPVLSTMPDMRAS